jgi:hypothetical protein
VRRLVRASAAALPGFASGSTGGLLGKLASFPFAAKLAAAAATVTAAGTIGFAELEARHSRPDVRERQPAAASSSPGQEAKLASAPRDASESTGAKSSLLGNDGPRARPDDARQDVDGEQDANEIEGSDDEHGDAVDREGPDPDESDGAEDETNGDYEQDISDLDDLEDSAQSVDSASSGDND